MRELLAVNVNVGGSVCTAELKIVKLCLGELCLIKSLCVKTSSAEVIVTTVKSVLCVPGMRKVNGYRTLGGVDGGAVLDKLPVIVNI
jgi:hypothetical protein